MSQVDDLTAWLGKLNTSDTRAPDVIWKAYFEKLVRLARGRLGSLPRQVADEEDVALSAMNSFIQGARAGRFPKLDDRDDLWKLLVTITARKVCAQQRRHFAEKRGGGAVRGESVFLPGTDDVKPQGIDGVLGEEPTPQFAAQVAEECNHLLDQLDDPLLCDIARMKVEGYTNEEIAEEIGRNVRTVERKLALIRDQWSPDAS